MIKRFAAVVMAVVILTMPMNVLAKNHVTVTGQTVKVTMDNGKAGEFASKWFTKGLRVSVSGRLDTGSYTNKKGDKVYTTEVIVEEQEFAQSKNEATEVRANFEPFAMAKQTELPFS